MLPFQLRESKWRRWDGNRVLLSLALSDLTYLKKTVLLFLIGRENKQFPVLNSLKMKKQNKNPSPVSKLGRGFKLPDRYNGFTSFKIFLQKLGKVELQIIPSKRPGSLNSAHLISFSSSYIYGVLFFLGFWMESNKPFGWDQKRNINYFLTCNFIFSMRVPAALLVQYWCVFCLCPKLQRSLWWFFPTCLPASTAGILR